MADQQLPLSNKQVILWWETRRLLFDLLLFLVGFLSLIGFEFLMEKVIPPGEDAIEPFALFFGVIVYAVMANLCYTMGWIVELGTRGVDPAAARRRGKWMFRAGMWFSGLLTSAPLWYALLFYWANAKHAGQ